MENPIQSWHRRFVFFDYLITQRAGICFMSMLPIEWLL
jgi:hypothetical protein